MTALAPEALTATGGKSAKGHTLIELYIITDNGGFTHHNAGTVVNEEILTDSCTGVNVDAGNAVGMLSHNSGKHRHVQGIQHMSKPVHSNGKQTGICKNNLRHIRCCRVTLIGGLQIRLHHRPNFRNLPEKRHSSLLRMGFSSSFLLTRALIHQRKLVGQVVHHVLDEHRQIMLGIIHTVVFILKITGEHDSAKLINNGNHHILIRSAMHFQLVNIPLTAVIVQNSIYQRFNFLFKGCHFLHLPFFFSLFIS